MSEYDSTVKFDSQQAERNVSSFAQKIGLLFKRSKEASAGAAELNTSSVKAQSSLKSMGLNAEKAAKGLLSYEKAAGAAMRASGRLMSSLRPATLAAAARSMTSLSRETERLAIASRSASSSTDRISTNIGKLSTRAVKAAKDIALINPALNKMVSGSTKSSSAFDRLVNRLNKLATELRKTATAGQSLVNVLAKLGITTRISVTGLSGVATAASKASSGVAKTSSAMTTGSGAAAKYNAAIKISQRNLGGMAGELVRARNVAVYFAAGLGIDKIVEYIDSVNEIRARLSLLGGTYQQTAVIERNLQKISLDSRTGYKENAALFTKLSLAGRAYGVSATTALTVTENVAKAMRISGSSTSEVTAATQQLAQAFSSGRIQGDELRSVLENSPRLALALSTELADLGINLGNIRDKASEGKIGINELVRAFGGASITKQLTEEFKKVPVTIGGALTNAGTKLQVFLGNLDKSIGITKTLVGVINLVSDNFDKIAIAAGAAGAAILLSYVPALIVAIRETRIFIATSIAKYGLDIATSYRSAAAGIGLFNARLATGKITSFTDALTLSRINIGNLGRLASRVFLRIPYLAAVGAAGIAAFENQNRLTTKNVASMQDYMVSGFQLAFSKIGQFASYLGSLLDRVFTWAGNRILGIISNIYTVAKGLINFVRAGFETLGEVGKLFPGGDTADFKRPGRNFRRRSRSGMAEDFSNAVEGTTLDRNAKERALERTLQQSEENGVTFGLGGFTGYLDQKRAAGLFDGKAGGGGIAPSAGGGGGKKKKKGGDSTGEMDALRASLDSLRSSLDPVEKSRQQFNEGLKTLDESMRKNILSTTEYKKLVASLAADTFPGLKDDIVDLAKENDKLRASLDGQSESAASFSEKVKLVETQIGQIDEIIKKDGDRTGALQAQRDALIGQVSSYRDLVTENERLKSLDEARLEKIRQITSLVDDAMNKLQESFTSAIRGALSLKGNSFKSFFKSIGNMFRDTLASALSAELFAPIQAKIRATLERSFGLGSLRSDTGSGTSTQGSVKASLGIDQTFKDFMESVARDSGSKPSSSSSSSKTDNGKAAANDNESPEIVVQAKRQPKGFFEAFATTYIQKTKQTFSQVANVLTKPLSKIAEQFGVSSEAFGEAVGTITAGATIGGMTADLGKAIGIKTSKAGGQIGGAIGGLVAGPLGSLIGGVLGSVVGGILKKTKKATSTISTSDTGQVVAGEAVGNSASHKQAANALSGSVKGKLGEIASALGGTITGGLSLGSIGQRNKKFTFDPSGSGKTKGAGVLKFSSEEEAIEAAVKNALTKGVIAGLSATSDKVLRTFKDIDRAIVVAGTIENVKRQAAAIRDPVKAALDQIKKDTESVIAIFKEAGASSEDYADLLVVVNEQMKQATEQQLGQLKEFRDSLKTGDMSYLSPTAKLQAANDKFKSIEARVAKGEFVNQAEFTSAGTTLQAIAREVFGSTPEFAAIQARLIAATDSVINNASNQSAAYQPVIDAITAQTQAAAAAAATSAANGTTQNQLLKQIADSLAAGGYGNFGGSFFNAGSFLRAA